MNVGSTGSREDDELSGSSYLSLVQLSASVGHSQAMFKLATSVARPFGTRGYAAGSEKIAMVGSGNFGSALLSGDAQAD